MVSKVGDVVENYGESALELMLKGIGFCRQVTREPFKPKYPNTNDRFKKKRDEQDKDVYESCNYFLDWLVRHYEKGDSLHSVQSRFGMLLHEHYGVHGHDFMVRHGIPDEQREQYDKQNKHAKILGMVSGAFAAVSILYLGFGAPLYVALLGVLAVGVGTGNMMGIYQEQVQEVETLRFYKGVDHHEEVLEHVDALTQYVLEERKDAVLEALHTPL